MISKIQIKKFNISKNKDDKIEISIQSDCVIPISVILPQIESFGFFVLNQRIDEDLNIFEVQNKSIKTNVNKLSSNIEEIFFAMHKNKITSDKIVSLSISESFNLRKILLLQTMIAYQTQISEDSIENIKSVVVEHSEFSSLIIDLFCRKFSEASFDLKDTIERCNSYLNKVTNQNEDRILKCLMEIVVSIVRTNYFLNKDYISIKIDPKKISTIKKPVLFMETFVYSGDFEAVHLRGDKISRGGIRWSDRMDYRTEALGLTKAQMTKNPVIVPDGCKGCFKLKIEKKNFHSNDEYVSFAIFCYKNFLRGMLDITDNIVNGEIKTPNIVTYDDKDHYLVVAADKGTATFSDYANEISKEYNFWLNDAFASGGKNGYDHKKIGITSRGAFISAIRHLSKMGINPYRDEFTAIGIGDMSGDVFGNGFLMTDKYRLFAAFNHIHIFVDPNPNSKISYEERSRLFELKGSTWQDYNKELISNGGGVFDRFAKDINLTNEMRFMFKIDNDQKTIKPDELIKLILKLDVDLIWNGGIGTYIKSSLETHSDVCDKINDSVRCDGNEIKARCIIEGGNLGVSQLGRIEYAACGGMINTDFIDNSGGVDCSDHEVNIKIALNSAVSSGNLTIAERDEFLASMANEVRDLVLIDNSEQTLAIIISQLSSAFNLDITSSFIDYLEKTGILDREIEFLPSGANMKKRANDIAQNPVKFKNINDASVLTGPELAVLLSYSKRYLYSRLIGTKLVGEVFCDKYLLAYFPSAMRSRFKNEILSHSLRKAIVTTVLTNKIINKLSGPIFNLIKNDTGAKSCDIARGYIISEEIFDINEIWNKVDNLDDTVSLDSKIDLFTQIIRLIRRSISWFVTNLDHPIKIEDHLRKYKDKIKFLLGNTDKFLNESHIKHKIDSYAQKNISDEIGREIAILDISVSLLDIISVCVDLNFEDHIFAAKTYFEIGEFFNIDLIRKKSDRLLITDLSYSEILSIQSVKNDLYLKQTQILACILKNKVSLNELILPRKELFDKYISFTNIFKNEQQENVDINVLIITNKKLSMMLKKMI